MNIQQLKDYLSTLENNLTKVEADNRDLLESLTHLTEIEEDNKRLLSLLREADDVAEDYRKRLVVLKGQMMEIRRLFRLEN